MLRLVVTFPEHELHGISNSEIFIEVSFCVSAEKENPSNIFSMDSM